MSSNKEQHAALDLNDECFSSDHFRMFEFKVRFWERRWSQGLGSVSRSMYVQPPKEI